MSIQKIIRQKRMPAQSPGKQGALVDRWEEPWAAAQPVRSLLWCLFNTRLWLSALTCNCGLPYSIFSIFSFSKLIEPSHVVGLGNNWVYIYIYIYIILGFQCQCVSCSLHITIQVSDTSWVCCSEKEKRRGMSFFFPFPENKEGKENSEQAWTFLAFVFLTAANSACL